MEPLSPDSYTQFLADRKSRIRTAQLHASLAVNRELILLYWQIGRDILDRQDREGWGAKIIDRLAIDLKRAFPEMKGLSPRNLKYMRRFAEVWTEAEFVQQVAAQLPWFHNCVLLDKEGHQLNGVLIHEQPSSDPPELLDRRKPGCRVLRAANPSV